MLTCPFCQFENTGKPEFCQRCSEALQTWYALLLPRPDLCSPVSVGPFLDTNQRYRLPNSRTTLLPPQPQAMQVVDCCPNAASPLKDLQIAWLENPQLDPYQSSLAKDVPSQAFPYLALQADYFPAIPEIHSAFYTCSHAVLLIEDRTVWSPLKHRWQQRPDSVLQHLQWLFEIVLLWEALIPWQQEAVLLKMNHLVTDANDLLCLSQLDSGSVTKSVSLQHLGYCWQKFLREIETPSPQSSLAMVADALVTGQIATIDRLKEALATLAEQRDSSTFHTKDMEVDNISEADHISADGKTSSPQSSPVPPEILLDEPYGASYFSWEDDLQQTLTKDDPIELTSASQDLSSSAAATNGTSEPSEMPTMVLPMKLAQIDAVGQTHVGIQRNHNEDCFFAQTTSVKVDTVDGITLSSKGLYVVCDGMGGHASGEVASQLAVKALNEFFAQTWQQELPDQNTLTKAVLTANQAIYDVNQANATSGLGRMGTTLVMLLVHNLSAAVVHVGDSRLYRYCKRLGLQQLTLDHEVGQREINRGIEPAIAYARPDAYQLTQALGPRHRDEVKPSISYHEIGEDTLFLLCSDGLSDNNLLERHATSHIAPLLSAKTNLENGLAVLIDLANEKNGHDNITAILTRLKLRPDMNNLPR